MRRIVVFLLWMCMLSAGINGNAQDLLNEDFSVWPPSGWTIQNQAGNWGTEYSVQSGGSPPEAKLTGSPAFFNITRLISPTFNLSGFPQAKLEFRQMLDMLAPGFTIGVATRTGTGAWNTVWSYNGSVSLASLQQTISINNGNTNQANFQFCFFFLGNSQNITTWYLDDVRFYIPSVHDIGLQAVLSPETAQFGAAYLPMLTVKNHGLSVENAVPVFCQVFDSSDNVIYTNQQYVNAFASGAVDTVSFTPFFLPGPNALYRILFYSALFTDLIKSNDTLRGLINTYVLSERRYVLLEQATATWCAHCPAASNTAQEMVNAGEKIALIAYHTNSGDPFTNPSSEIRLGFYSILGYPTAEFDGVLTHVGSSNVSTQYPARYIQRKTVGSPFDMRIYGTQAGANISLDVVIRKLAPVNLPALKLYVALTESGIPYTWLGQTHVHHVARALYPSAYGQEVNTLNNNIQHIISVSVIPEAGWNLSNCELIAFLQDTLTGEVYQVDKVMIPQMQELQPANATGHLLYENSSSTPLPGAKVHLRQGFYPLDTTVTDNTGGYTFSGLLPGTYTLKCSSTMQWGGGNAADAFLIMKMFVMGEDLPGLKSKAADTDNSGYANTVDALNVMRRFVGFITTFTAGDWIFEDAQVTVTNGGLGLKNIRGICTGDIDVSFSP